MSNIDQSHTNLSKISPNLIWYLWGTTFLLLCLVFRNSLQDMLDVWLNVEEYSHGIFIPVITLYFLWLRRSEFTICSKLTDSFLGLFLMLIGLFLFILGGMAALRPIEQYAFLVVLAGLFAVVFGYSGLKIASVPLLFLFFMVPFPAFIISNLSSKLQLVSSWLGVEFIRSCNIMVFLEGNVIDLGEYKLQVVDACSGLRYLFPLSSLAFLCAFLFKGPFWQKFIIFLSSVPLTIFMNSFRIGVIGVLVDNWGSSMAEGFLHDFEGWAVFLLCMVLLFIEMWIFSRISGQNFGFSELVQIPAEWGTIKRSAYNPVLNHSIYIVLVLLFIGFGASELSKNRVDIIPERKAFVTFPSEVGLWHGQNQYLSKLYLDELKLTDYVVMDYFNSETGNKVNFYSAYYETQRKGAGVHSPRSCIPGSGWRITLFEEQVLPEFTIEGESLHIDRAIIEKGENKQLVYFWFQQRGRTLTNEYLMKWYIFYDSLTMNRTDGALVRLVTDINSGEDLSNADQRIQGLLRDILPQLGNYIPGK